MYKIFRLGLIILVFTFLFLVNGCQTTSKNSLISGADNIYGDPLIVDIPLNNTVGIPSDGDRTLFQPIYFSYDLSLIHI